jgi:hypothetical protein
MHDGYGLGNCTVKLESNYWANGVEIVVDEASTLF